MFPIAIKKLFEKLFARALISHRRGWVRFLAWRWSWSNLSEVVTSPWSVLKRWNVPQQKGSSYTVWDVICRLLEVNISTTSGQDCCWVAIGEKSILAAHRRRRAKLVAWALELRIFVGVINCGRGTHVKGTVSRGFWLKVFFRESGSPHPQTVCFEFFLKFAEIFAALGAPPVSLTKVANKKDRQSENVKHFFHTFE